MAEWLHLILQQVNPFHVAVDIVVDQNRLVILLRLGSGTSSVVLWEGARSGSLLVEVAHDLAVVAEQLLDLR